MSTRIIAVDGVPTRAVSLARQRERDMQVYEDTLRRESLDEQERDFMEAYAAERWGKPSSDIRGIADWVQRYMDGGRFAAG